jgi:hypothetical protein
MLYADRQQSREILRIALLDQQMETVVHLAIMQELENESIAVARHDVKERATLLVIGEDRLRIVAREGGSVYG